MAEGLSNHAIGQRLFLNELGITDDDNNRRVLAVLAYLNNP
ncbi:hypothetical protein [Micromonospora arborensis]